MVRSCQGRRGRVVSVGSYTPRRHHCTSKAAPAGWAELKRTPELLVKVPG